MSITHANVVDWIEGFAADVAERRSELTKLDTAIGDGDHGTNMDRGMRKAVEKLEATDGEDIGATLKAVGMALVSSVGGAGGPLYGTFFMQMGAAAAGKAQLEVGEWAHAVEAGVEGVRKRGRAEPGDKTMVDALLPAVEALKRAAEAGADAGEALRRGADAAQEGMQATVGLVARKGRASYLGERSAGHQDPGATSTYLMLDSAAKAVAR